MRRAFRVAFTGCTTFYRYGAVVARCCACIVHVVRSSPVARLEPCIFPIFLFDFCTNVTSTSVLRDPLRLKNTTTDSLHCVIEVPARKIASALVQIHRPCMLRNYGVHKAILELIVVLRNQRGCPRAGILRAAVVFRKPDIFCSLS